MSGEAFPCTQVSPYWASGSTNSSSEGYFKGKFVKEVEVKSLSIVSVRPKFIASETNVSVIPKEVLFNKCLASFAVKFPEKVSK